MAKNRERRDAELMLQFCAKHMITHNRSTIWQLKKQFDMVAANARKSCRAFNLSSNEPAQTSLNFGPRSGWRTI